IAHCRPVPSRRSRQRDSRAARPIGPPRGVRAVILLETNVISALMQREADPVVVAWLDTQPPESIWTTSITVFEVRVGLELLASGKRRRSLEAAFNKSLEEDFE